VLVAGGIAAADVLRVDAYRLEVLVVCAAAVVLLAGALAFGGTSLVPWPLVVLAGAYAWSLGTGPVDQWAPVYAGALLALAELSYWSLELRGRAQDAERLNERRAGLIVGLALGSVAVGGLVLAATSLPLGSGAAFDLLGVVAAVAAVTLVASVARAKR
jgi:hypothetical protein